MKTFLFILALLATSFDTLSAGSINFLEVDNDVVLFSTSDTKITTSPACVATDNANLWTVSLASDSGRAIYSLILTSMAKGDGVALNIESAEDCADKNGFERASKVNLVLNVEVSDSPSGANSIGLYKSDGVTRVGTYLSETSYNIYYVDDDPQAFKKIFFRQSGSQQSSVHYTGSDCTGDVWVSQFTPTVQKELQRNETLSNGAYFDIDLNTKDKPVTNSYANGSGNCVVKTYSTSWRYKPAYQNHSLCGANLCTLKQD